MVTFRKRDGSGTVEYRRFTETGTGTATSGSISAG